MVTTVSARVLFLCTLVLLDPAVEARRGGGSGGVGRGSSGGRAQVGRGGSGGFHPSGNANTGHHTGPAPGHHNGPAAGGFRSGPGSGPSGGGGFHSSGARSFRPSNGVGSVKQTSSLKTALLAGAAGAVGGIVVYEAGKAIIRSTTEPFQYESRNYYFDNYQRVPSGQFVCHMPVSDLAMPDPADFFSTLQFRDGSRPGTLTWVCRSGAEVCCGTDCCAVPGSSSSSNSLFSKIGALILIGLLVAGLVCFCRCCKRRSSDTDMSDSDNHNNQDANKYANDDPSDSCGQQQQQSYPMLSYGDGYPPQQQQRYPSYPPPSNAYPPNPGAHSSYPVNSH